MLARRPWQVRPKARYCKRMSTEHPTDPAFWRAQAAATSSLAEKTNDTYLKGIILRRADEFMWLAKEAEARLMLSR